MEMTTLIIDRLREKIQVHKLTEAEQVQDALQKIMSDILLADYPETPDFYSES